MTGKKYQVFISSTYIDLKDERNDISRAILNLDHIPAGMELFPAIDEEQFTFIQKVIDDCDYYVLIIGGRYGSLSENGLGYTELEYDYAIEKGMKVIALVHSETENIAVIKSETDPKLIEKLAAFRKKVTSGRLARFWQDRPTLQAAFYESFSQTINRYPATGWVRADSISNHDLLVQINAVRNENEKLRAELEASRPKPLSFGNLASMDEEFIFHIDHGRGGSFGRREAKMTWRRIYLYVAAEVRGMRGREDINIAVTKSMLGFNAGSAPIEYLISDTDWETILVQFTAAGLISTEDRRRYELTERGLSFYINNRVVRDHDQ